jgi:hypothetical protein
MFARGIWDVWMWFMQWVTEPSLKRTKDLKLRCQRWLGTVSQPCVADMGITPTTVWWKSDSNGPKNRLNTLQGVDSIGSDTKANSIFDSVQSQQHAKGRLWWPTWPRGNRREDLLCTGKKQRCMHAGALSYGSYYRFHTLQEIWTEPYNFRNRRNIVDGLNGLTVFSTVGAITWKLRCNVLRRSTIALLLNLSLWLSDIFCCYRGKIVLK